MRLPAIILAVAMLFPAMSAADDKHLPKEGPGDASITYEKAVKAPEKYRGKRVAWTAWAPTSDGTDVLVVANPAETDDRKHLRYVVRCATRAEAEKLSAGGRGQVTGTISGRTMITYQVSDGMGGFRERTEDVPLLVHSKFKEVKKNK